MNKHLLNNFMRTCGLPTEVDKAKFAEVQAESRRLFGHMQEHNAPTLENALDSACEKYLFDPSEESYHAMMDARAKLHMNMQSHQLVLNCIERAHILHLRKIFLPWVEDFCARLSEKVRGHFGALIEAERAHSHEILGSAEGAAALENHVARILAQVQGLPGRLKQASSQSQASAGGFFKELQRIGFEFDGFDIEGNHSAVPSVPTQAEKILRQKTALEAELRKVFGDNVPPDAGMDTLMALWRHMKEKEDPYGMFGGYTDAQMQPVAAAVSAIFSEEVELSQIVTPAVVESGGGESAKETFIDGLSSQTDEQLLALLKANRAATLPELPANISRGEIVEALCEIAFGNRPTAAIEKASGPEAPLDLFSVAVQSGKGHGSAAIVTGVDESAPTPHA